MLFHAHEDLDFVLDHILSPPTDRAVNNGELFHSIPESR